MRLMIDLETMDTAPSAAIVQIGAVFFDDEHLYEEFSMNVDLATAMRSGGTVGAETIQWWLAQSPEARHALRDPIPVSIEQAFQSFYRFIQYQKFDYAWSHGSSFDLVILDQTARRLGKRLPWHFFDVRDTRTLFGMVDEAWLQQKKDEADKIWPLKHVAVEDAKRQAWSVIQAEKALKNGIWRKSVDEDN